MSHCEPIVMKIIADKNIPLVKQVFSHLGRVETVPAGMITQELVCDADILLVRSVTTIDEPLLAGSWVRFVATSTSGVDHVDRGYLDSRRVGFAYAPGSNAQSVAEYVITALHYCGLKHSFALKDKVVGIVGVGHIGKRVLHMARRLGMRCLCNDPPRARKEGPGKFVTLDELLAVADIITLHVPLTDKGPDATLRLVDETFLRRMKRGAFLINTSRGRVIDESTLKKMREKLGGLVLDVWDNEPSIDTELLAMTDCGTPHIAGYSYDGKINGAGMVYRAVCDFLGQEPRWKPSEHLAVIPICELSLPSTCADPLSEAVLRAYPIGRDVGDMRGLIAMPAEDGARYFARLREHYPRRLEFKHFSIHTRADDAVARTPSTRQDLAGLGFQLK